jgi:hypothetical protein
MLIVQALVGFAVLILGRQLFWVFVGGVGFILGIIYAAPLYQGQPTWVMLAVGLVAGMLGALFAYSLQRFAAAIAGFAGGWYLGVFLASNFGWNTGMTGMLIPAICAIIGVGLIFVVFDWSLILLSSLSGAAIIIQATNYDSQLTTILFVSLFFLGLVVQAVLYMQDQDVE